MIDWSLFEFRGIVPRLRGRSLPKTYATVAHDVDLTHGTLKPFREPLKVSDASSGARIYSNGCHIFTFDKCVDLAKWIPDCPRLFLTGRVGYPETGTVDAQGNVTYRRLGVPMPDSAIITSNHDVDTEESRSVSYVATYVNNFGEEGPPSLPSPDISIEDGEAVTLQFDFDPPMEYDIRKIRIYRRESGFVTGAEKETTPNTNWYLLTELPIDEFRFIDNKHIEELGFPLSTTNTREPPANIRTIRAVQDTAILAASLGNKVLFSKNMQPHNWMLSNELTLDDNIVDMQAVGGSLFVATDGHPYVISADGACDDMKCRGVAKYDVPMPMINCHTGKGSVATPMGMVYASTDGLVMLTEAGQPSVITTDFLSADDWRMLEPQTTRLAYHKGALFVVTNAISFIMWMDNITYKDSEHKNLVTISDEPIDMTETRQGELLLMKEDGIYQWNASEKLRPYKWVSEEIQSGFLLGITRIRARVLDCRTDVTLESKWGEITRSHSPQSGIIPYGRLARHTNHFIRAEGTGELSELIIGVSGLDMGTK